ncbi:MAG: hypothetical protein M3R35_03160 [Candidatus Eremiobacteraeota bacterium]|nr:hypothetical protein [Candidatus Eremiobacteraeota bacterium]
MTALSPHFASVRAAFSSLIDYAGLFPPAKLDMDAALAEYEKSRRGAFAWMLGRFIVPAGRLEELLASPQLVAEPPLAASVIVDAGSDPRAWFGNAQALLARIAALRSSEKRIAIETLEAPLPALATRRETHDASIGQFAMLVQAAGLRDVPAFLELPAKTEGELLGGAMFALARHGLRAKVRCGGVTADNVPSPQALAEFIRAAAAETVPFKATAGLHHPLRHHNEAAGFTMHGFLNVLAAAVFAISGADDDAVCAALSLEDAGAFTFDADGMQCAGRRVTTEQIQRARREAFIGYGSCSFDEPVDDLIGLRMLERPQ